MATYLLINVIFIMLIITTLRLRIHRPSKKWLLVLIVLLLLTTVFDSLIIYFEIVAYDPEKILGIYIGKAPIEDFFYAIIAAVIVPVIWNKMEGKK